MNNPLWFKDAVIYQLHVKTLQESDGDGVGDFGGLMQRLDYLAELGVTDCRRAGRVVKLFVSDRAIG